MEHTLHHLPDVQTFELVSDTLPHYPVTLYGFWSKLAKAGLYVEEPWTFDIVHWVERVLGYSAAKGRVEYGEVLESFLLEVIETGQIFSERNRGPRLAPDAAGSQRMFVLIGKAELSSTNLEEQQATFFQIAQAVPYTTGSSQDHPGKCSH